MKSTIGVVNFTVSELSTISLDMDSIHRHSVRVSAEDGRLVHIIPEAVHVVATLENRVIE